MSEVYSEPVEKVHYGFELEQRPAVGTVLNRSFAIFQTGFVPCVTLALIAYSPSLVLQLFFENFFNPTAVNSSSFHPAVFLIPFALFVFLTIALALLASAAMVYGVFQLLRGLPMSVERSLRIAASRAPSVIGLSILSALAIGLGLMCCLIPGTVIYCGLFIAAPALMVEKLPATDAMSRSWKLTEGYKGMIFLFLVVVGLLQAIPANLTDWITRGFHLAGSQIWLSTAAVIDYGITSVVAAFSAVAAAVVYHDIRLFREGLGEEELASVFD